MTFHHQAVHLESLAETVTKCASVAMVLTVTRPPASACVPRDMSEQRVKRGVPVTDTDLTVLGLVVT